MGMEIFTTSGVFFSEQYGLKDGDVLQILCVGGGGGGGRGGSGAPGSGGRGGSGGGAGGGGGSGMLALGTVVIDWGENGGIEVSVGEGGESGCDGWESSFSKIGRAHV